MKPYRISRGIRELPLVLSIPHSGTFIPADVRSEIILDDQKLQHFIDEAIDWYTDEIYDVVNQIGGVCLCHSINRIVVDTERFEDDASEPMAQKGLGVIYEKTNLGEPFRKAVSPERREQLIAAYYRNYHLELDRLVSEAIDRFGYCLLLDCHSFGAIRVPSPFYDQAETPGLCIGTDSHHSPERLTAGIEKIAQELGFSTAFDFPYSGVVVPLRLYKDPRVLACMLELNKSLYLEEGTINRRSDFPMLLERMKDLIFRSVELAQSCVVRPERIDKKSN